MNYNIDQDLININNSERTLIGKKSEYNVKNLLLNYIKEFNEKMNEEKYIYLENIDIFKLFNVKLNNNKDCKGEIDGIILKKKIMIILLNILLKRKVQLKLHMKILIKLLDLNNFY